MDFPYKSTKTFHQAFPVAYRQWRADSHCQVTHGYALTVHLEFGGFDLDARNWLVDFGSLRGLKGQLEDWFDHAHLAAQDDPEVELLRELGRRRISKITEVERTGCEGLSDFIFEHLNDGWLRENGYGDRVICTKVEVRETDANMAMRCLTEADYERFCGKLPQLPDCYEWERTGDRTHIKNSGLRIFTSNSFVHRKPGYGLMETGPRFLLARTVAEYLMEKL